MSFLPKMTPFSAEDYEQLHWSLLRDTLETLLSRPQGSFKAISYEQMYSAVYKCVCRQYGERLFEDLTAHLAGQVGVWRSDLEARRDCPSDLVHALHRHLAQYRFALASIVPIFTYLNRFYVETKLHTDLDTVLRGIFVQGLGDDFIPRAVQALARADFSPPVQPSVMHELVNNIHNLDQKYANENPQLFSR